MNENFTEYEGSYGNAKSIFHELAAHADNSEVNESQGHLNVGIEGGTTDNRGYFKERIRRGSKMDKFDKELKSLILEDRRKKKEEEKNRINYE